MGFIFFILFIYFLQWFLPYIDRNQPWIYICSLSRPHPPHLSHSGFLLCGFCFSDRFPPHEDSPEAPGLNVPPGCNLKEREVIILPLFTLNSSPETPSWPCLDCVIFPEPITVSRSHAHCEVDVGPPSWWLCPGGKWELLLCAWMFKTFSGAGWWEAPMCIILLISVV